MPLFRRKPKYVFHRNDTVWYRFSYGAQYPATIVDVSSDGYSVGFQPSVQYVPFNEVNDRLTPRTV